MRTIACLLTCCCLAISFALPVAAQDGNDGAGSPALADSAEIEAFYIDFTTPDLSAFTMLGVEGAGVSRPQSVRELALALQNGFTRPGVLEQGLGVELSPAWIFAKPTVIGEYRPLVHRFTLSAATVQSADSTRFGIGFRWVPIDGADPYGAPALRQDLIASLEDTSKIVKRSTAFTNMRVRGFLDSVGISSAQQFVFARLLDPVSGPADISLQATIDALDEEFKEIDRTLTPAQADTLEALAEAYIILARAAKNLRTEAAVGEVLKKRRAEFARQSWNAAAVQIAAGFTWFTPGPLDTVDPEAFRAFASGAFPLGTWGRATGHAQVAMPFEDGKDTAWTFGGELMAGTAVTRFSVQALYGVNDERLVEGDAFRLTVGGEFKLTDGTYLELVTGINAPGVDTDGLGNAHLLSLGGIKYAFRSNRRYDIP